MSIFKQINITEENEFRRITINKMDCCNDHFGDERMIISFLDRVNQLFYDKERNENDLVALLFDYLRNSPRIQKIEFFKGKLAMVVLLVSSVPEFAKVPIFKRNITVDCKDHKFILSLVEILKPEYESILDGDIKLPKSWKPQPHLTKSFNRLRILI